MPTVKGEGLVKEPGQFQGPGQPLDGEIEVLVTDVMGENEGLFQRVPIKDKAGKVVGSEPVLVDGKPVPAISECVVVTCLYPEGFSKQHQVRVLNEDGSEVPLAEALDDLTTKITRQVRGHFNVTRDLPYKRHLTKLEVGEKLTFGGVEE